MQQSMARTVVMCSLGKEKKGGVIMIRKAVFRKKAAPLFDVVLRSLLTLSISAVFAGFVTGQTPKSTPSEQGNAGDYEITSSFEVGVRGLDINGSENKFRSDLNYKNGVRLFDSSFLIEDKSKNAKIVDSILITSSGWGADPSGFFRINAEKTGIYRIESNIRRVNFFNNLNNHALNQHNADIQHNLADTDLTIFPESQKLRFRLGYSRSQTSGPGGFTTRAYGDEYPVTTFAGARSDDFRGGIEGQLFGINLSLSHGYRRFKDTTQYILTAPNLGNNPTNNARLFTFERSMPTVGFSHHTMFTAQRTFAKKLDVTGRFVYSTTNTRFSLFETITGRDSSNNQVDLDRFNINGDAKRPQARGDLGITYMFTENFRISNTFSYDQFNISGGNLFAEALFTRTPTGGPRATVFTNTFAHRITSYQRALNTIEGDYQFSDRVGFNIGYRFTRRRVALEGTTRNFASATPTIFSENFENNTGTLIAGMKIKPIKNWVIFWDVEHGKADNVFTRLANYDFTNFRVRSRMSFNRLALNFSAISKDNNNPGRSIDVPSRDFSADVQNRIFSGSIDWTPMDKLSFSGGYTYNHLTSETAIIVPVNSVRLQGLSRYFVRDHSAYFDVSARPIKRISFYAAYRINDDRGQGNVVSTRLQDIFTSYPMKFQSPEVRVAIRLTRNVDWNVGYQYYDYKETFQSAQDYRAHLPYTSLRIYFGRGAADR